MPGQRKKILYVSHNHPAVRPGGAEAYALDLYKAVRDTGEFEPVLLCRAGKPVSPIDRYHDGSPLTTVTDDPNQYLFYNDLEEFDWLFHRLPDKREFTRHYTEFLEAQRPDIVHFQHVLYIGFDVLRLTRNVLPDVPIIFTLHEYLAICHRNGQMVRRKASELCSEESPRRCNECFPHISPQEFFMRKRFIKSHMSVVDFFIAPTQYTADRYIDWGVPPSKIVAEPYGVFPVARPETVQEKTWNVERRNRFAFFGQLTPFKGAEVLLKAMKILGDSFDGHVWIFGANLDMQEDQFKDEMADLLAATRNTVTFAGEYDRADLPKLMRKIDWVLVPSIWYETGPFVVYEAFQYGRPVICSDTGGMAEKVKHGVSGLHFARNDPDSLAGTMRHASRSPGLWGRLRAGIPPVHTMDDHVEVLSGIYNRLVDAKAQQKPALSARMEAVSGA
jgi:glycosyltransferase involved in cell wall biosynthesis